MGYSISQEQHDKLQRHQREGRVCCWATGRGGCFNRATVRVTQDGWPYHLDEGEATRHVMTACKTHAKTTPVGYEGVNFRILTVEEY